MRGPPFARSPLLLVHRRAVVALLCVVDPYEHGAPEDRVMTCRRKTLDCGDGSDAGGQYGAPHAQHARPARLEKHHGVLLFHSYPATAAPRAPLQAAPPLPQRRRRSSLTDTSSVLGGHTAVCTLHTLYYYDDDSSAARGGDARTPVVFITGARAHPAPSLTNSCARARNGVDDAQISPMSSAASDDSNTRGSSDASSSSAAPSAAACSLTWRRPSIRGASHSAAPVAALW